MSSWETSKNKNKLIAAIKAAGLARLPVMLIGAPGVGKTATIRTIAEDMDYELITLVGSQFIPEDIRGLPKGVKIDEDENGEAIWGTVDLMPDWQHRILRKKKIMLFLDEWSNTPSSVQASMLTLLQNREFPNGMKMPDETIVLGAMNPTSQAVDGYELGLPTTNRLIFLPWITTYDEWYDGMLAAWGNTEVSKEEMNWRRKVVLFIKDNPTMIHREPNPSESPRAFSVASDESSEEVFRNAWASRRSWDHLCKVLAVTPEDTYIQDLLMQGTVGYAAANEFRGWLREHNTISPEDALKKPKSVKWKTLELNDATMILRGVSSIIDESNILLVPDFVQVIVDNDKANLIAPYLIDILQAGDKVKDRAKVKKFKDEMNNLVQQKNLLNYIKS